MATGFAVFDQSFADDFATPEGSQVPPKDSGRARRRKSIAPAHVLSSAQSDRRQSERRQSDMSAFRASTSSVGHVEPNQAIAAAALNMNMNPARRQSTMSDLPHRSSVADSIFLQSEAAQDADDDVTKAEQDSTTVSVDDVTTDTSKKKATAALIGLSDEDPIVVAFDVAYVVVAVVACGLVLYGAAPYSELQRDWYALSVAVSVVLSVFSMAWVALRFFVQCRTGKWEIIDRVGDIRNAYLAFWFRYDMLYALPVDLVFLGWADGVFLALQWRHFLRLGRVVVLSRSANPLRRGRQWFRFTAFICFILLVTHTMAVIFGTIEAHEQRPYIDTLYWAVVTMTSVGYGDVVPNSSASSRSFAIVSMISGMVIIASVTAFVTAVLTTRDKLEEQLDAKKQMMDSMLNYYEIPWAIQCEVINVFPAVMEAQSTAEFEALTQALPSFVGNKIEGYQRIRVLKTAPMFGNLENDAILLMMSRTLVQRFSPASEYLILRGDIGREMFFLVRGVVEVLVPAAGSDGVVEDIVVACLRNGQVFGEVALLEDSVRTASVQCVTLCELLVLFKEDFDRTLEEYPQVAAVFEREREARQGKTAAAAQPVPDAGRESDETDGTTGDECLALPSPLKTPANSDRPHHAVAVDGKDDDDANDDGADANPLLPRVASMRHGSDLDGTSNGATVSAGRSPALSDAGNMAVAVEEQPTPKSAITVPVVETASGTDTGISQLDSSGEEGWEQERSRKSTTEFRRKRRTNSDRK
jgi:hypothetical protein